jgi:uncharacterized protein
MSGMYKTPGVYVEEIPKFPPSIAAVETAIPAFIGYTEKAIRNGESLINKPTRIESIAEYEEIFGGAPEQNISIVLDSSNQFIKSTAKAKLYLYDSLRMFYANGGGNSYILSVGTYPTTVSSTALENALPLLEMEDEPTIILAPDAVSAPNGPYEFQKLALMQCQKLMDRVTVCDLQNTTPTEDFKKRVDTFREKIGINSLKYGAAYGPWVNATFQRVLYRRNVALVQDDEITPIPLSSLTTDVSIQALISNLMNVESFVDALQSDETALLGGSNELEDLLKSLKTTYNALALGVTNGILEPTIQNVSKLGIDIVLKVNTRYTAAPAPATNEFKLKADIDNYIANAGIKDKLIDMVYHNLFLDTIGATKKFELVKKDASLTSAATFLTAVLPTVPDATIAALYTTAPAASTVKEHGNIAVTSAIKFVNAAISLFRFTASAQNNYEKIMNDALLNGFGLYKNLVIKGGEALNQIPPSGAIAGIYAATDRQRGVWKAPANISLNAVISPAVKISHEQQAEYNVDVNAGKSINIIRAFTGKGTLVWGARTLAGNDNEWRYISVRRLFNFVEESVKKATEQFVFEPNDANTWVRVQAMIENFLNTIWRQGALQGVKPEHAYYVAVGLGKTMTPLDILEGRMIVEIGMAAVRPAEFIILRFSHKMAES